jgi:HKD family nuclease
MDLLLHPDGDSRVGEVLVEFLSDRQNAFDSFTAAVAFVRRSGVRHICQALRGFVHNNGQVRIVIGIDHKATTTDGLQELLDCVEPSGEVFVFHNAGPSTYHPKIFLFENEREARVIIGSSNLTEGGLFTNYEASVILRLSKSNREDRAFLTKVKQAIQTWSDTERGTVHRLTRELVRELHKRGLIRSEQELYQSRPGEFEFRKTGNLVGPLPPTTEETGSVEQPAALFERVPVPRPPRITIHFEDFEEEEMPADQVTPVHQQQVTGFVMTLHRTDMGRGQTTPGTSPRSPEVFIPLGARNAHPQFWGWPEAFVEDPQKPGKRDRIGVRMLIGDQDADVNMMTWPDKRDFRLRNAELLRRGSIGDVLRIEKLTTGGEYEYSVEIIPQGTSKYDRYLELCVNQTRNSNKRWGYY